MNKKVHIAITVGFAALIIISWIVAIGAKSTAEKQFVLIGQARELIEDGIYILAVPMLEEAAGYDSIYTITSENELKATYLHLIENRGYSRKYTNLLEKQMSRKSCPPEVFMEAAKYYLSINAKQKAYEILRNAIERTGNNEITTMYENYRYAYEINRISYESVTAIYNQTIQVRQDNKWGIANSDGTILIPCEYDKVSTFSQNRVVVEKEGEIYAVDRNNNRIALAPDGIQDFRNLSEKRIPLLFGDCWYRAAEDFKLGTNMFEDIGMYREGYVAAKVNGMWGVIDIKTNWLVLPEYDEIITDQLGRCYAQDAFFVRSGEAVYLHTKNKVHKEFYQDAKPFSGEGYAAVKKDEKWGFIDTNGNLMIEYIFDDALSFGQHLAAVKIGDLWGYININGNVVIDTIFMEARSFSDGNAPVLTERGWQFITLIEYKRGNTL